MGIQSYLAIELAEEHRKDLLRQDWGTDREDLLRHHLELHRSRASSAPRSMEPLVPLRRRLQRALIGWLALIALVACGTLGSAGPTGSSEHVTKNPGIGLHRLDTEQAQAADPAADPMVAAGGYPPQERDVPELSSLLQCSRLSDGRDATSLGSADRGFGTPCLDGGAAARD